jgi:hypothetical protein
MAGALREGIVAKNWKSDQSCIANRGSASCPGFLFERVGHDGTESFEPDARQERLRISLPISDLVLASCLPITPGVAQGPGRGSSAPPKKFMNQ